jgi:hypothetical protein
MMNKNLTTLLTLKAAQKVTRLRMINDMAQAESLGLVNPKFHGKVDT